MHAAIESRRMEYNIEVRRCEKKTQVKWISRDQMAYRYGMQGSLAVLRALRYSWKDLSELIKCSSSLKVVQMSLPCNSSRVWTSRWIDDVFIAPMMAMVVLKLPMSRRIYLPGGPNKKLETLCEWRNSMRMTRKGPLTLAILMNFSIILARCLTLGGDKIMVPTQDEIKLKWAMHAWNAADPRFVFHTWRSMSLGCSKGKK